MMNQATVVDAGQAVDQLMRFLAVEGTTGHEAAIGREVVRALRAAEVPAKAMRFDAARERIPLPTETGNLIVALPGTRPGPRLLFAAHLDTVPPCAGAKPLRKGNRIVAEGNTALGGDNRTGCAVLVTLAETLLRHQLPHPPLTLLFTIREESGLLGARYLDPADLGGPAMGFNFDGRLASELCIGAVGAQRWQADIRGKAAHAGVHPEKGISAAAVAALAIGDAYRSGWFGQVVKGDRQGTSNVAIVGEEQGRSAGVATNVVIDYACVVGESRSHDAKFARAITAAYQGAFRSAAAEVRNDRGQTARMKFQTRIDYHSFRLKPNAPAVAHARAAAESLGRTPTLKVGNGGLDANWLVRHGIPTVTLGAGQNNIHTMDEFVDLTEFRAGCRMAVALATLGE